MHPSRRAVLVALGLLAATPLPNAAAAAPQLWFSPGDDLEVRGVVSHPDFMRLFDANSPWPTGLPKVEVMQLRAPWFMRMPPEAGKTVVDFLEQHHIQMAIPLGFVASDTCGQGVEGIGPTQHREVYPRELKRRGIELSYIVMDEPLFFGHDYDGKNACHLAINEVVNSVAKDVQMIRSYYPQIKFVWVEPPQSLAGGVGEMARFLDLYKLHLGEYPASARLDLAWGVVNRNHREWHADIPGFIDMLTERGIGYGIIYDAGPVKGRIPDTDAGWVGSAEANVADWQRTVHVQPNQAVLQTWSPNPARITPESDPSTMTGYLKWFVETQQR